MADEKNPIERLVEAALFAPLGIAAMVREELPKLVERGHQEANMAKAMGQFAVTMGRTELEKRLKQVAERPAQSRAQAKPAAPAPAPAPKPATPPAPAAAPAPAQAPAAAPVAPTPPSVPVAETNGSPVTVHDAQSLAIPGYDSLSASQVVERLAGLNGEELEAIGSYESAGRGRRTILNRVAQLRGSVTPGTAVPTPGVRAAVDTDVPFVAAMAEAAAAALHGARGAELMLLREAQPPDATEISEWLHHGDVTVLVGVLDDVPVGAGIGRLEVLTGGTRLAVVTMLWVDDAARSVGVGEEVLGGLVAWAQAAGCESIDAYALPGERITKNFFEAAGFKARLLTVSHRLDEPTP